MKRRLLLSPLIALLAIEAGHAASKCPVLTPGASYPWQTQGLMDGDKLVQISIDLDAKGQPTACRIEKNKVEGDLGFWICNSMKNDIQYEPLKKDGVPVAGTVKRSFFLMGRAHRRADEIARKRYFAEHPDLRPSCYP